MSNYVQKLSVTVWRKKTTVLVGTMLLVLSLFGLQYSRLEENINEQFFREERDAQVVADALMKSIKNVEFIENPKIVHSNPARVTRINVPEKNQPPKDGQFENEKEQLGIPFVNLDTKNPYVPRKRIVHLDLKGAPPIISYLKRLFPVIKAMGATGILLEYEDMFPYSGILKNISAKNAYTPNNIKEIINLAETLNLEIIPLIQTFGHVEFALKHTEFAHLREVEDSPQALCPSRSGSLHLVQELIDQIMALHPTAKNLHIGCDEVFQMGECDVCRLEMHENLFLKHIKNIAEIIKLKYAGLKVIMWDDMLRHLTPQSMVEYNLGDLVEPMVWVYAEDIYRFVQPGIWEKYTSVFRTAWTASAFKGAFGETLYIPNAKRHLENNLRWLDVMATHSASFKDGFRGLVLTGWQRYDHFAVLCELLPTSIPSLALSLTTVSHGFFNLSLRNKFLSLLNCPEQQTIAQPFINLDSDPFLWEKLSRCIFPGNPVFRLMNRLHNSETEVREYLDATKRQKGWLTSYNVRHNYSLPLRVEELTADLPRLYHGMVSLARIAVDAMLEVFDNYTISEWIEQRIYPYVIELERLQNESVALKGVSSWQARPLPPLKDMQRLGIGVFVH